MRKLLLLPSLLVLFISSTLYANFSKGIHPVKNVIKWRTAAAKSERSGTTANKLTTDPAPYDENGIMYVNQAIAGGNGSSWATPVQELRDALTVAAGDAGVKQIWVAKGTYLPTADDNRDVYFNIPDGVQIYGGFNGTETSTNNRNFTENTSILSGDIGVTGDNTDNSYHVVIAHNNTAPLLLDGFTISGAYDDSAVDFHAGPSGTSPGTGGALLLLELGANATLNNITASNNFATFGAGIHIQGNATTVVVNINKAVVFNNLVIGGGAGINITAPYTATINNSVFDSNIARSPDDQFGSGAGLQVVGGATVTVTNGVFNNNQALGTIDDAGGAVMNYGAVLNLVNCTLFNNITASTARPDGNGISNLFSGSTFVSNLVNTIIWSNKNVNIITGDGQTTYQNSLVKGSGLSSPNLDTDPLFVKQASPAGADGILGTADDGLQLSAASPARNAGTTSGAPETDITGTSRGATPDMGAYQQAGIELTSLSAVAPVVTNAAIVNYTATFAAPVSGLTANNFTLTTLLNGASVGTPATGDGGTTWTVPVNTGTGDGTIQLNLDNTTGITPGVSTALPFAGDIYAIDKTPPAAPTIPDMVAASDLGISSSDNNTSKTTPTLTGRADANSRLTLYDTDGTTGLGSTTANGSGKWTVISSELAEGPHTITAKTVDAAGNTSIASSGLDIIIDTTPPTITIANPSVSSIVAGAGSVVYNVTYADDNFYASTLTGDNITLNRTGSANASTIDVSGTGTAYTVTLSGITGKGTLGITVGGGTAQDLAGNLSLVSGESPTFDVLSPPVARVDNYMVTQNGVLTVTAPGVLGNDSDPADLALTAAVTTGPEHGTVVLDPSGSFVYTPSNGYSGSDGFYYRAFNGTLYSNVAAVNISVTPLNEQHITFNAIEPKTYGDDDFGADATSDNTDNAITLSSDNTDVAIIVNGNIKIVGAGTANITASQPEHGGYAAADQVQTLTVNKKSLTFTADNNTKVYGDPLPTLTASYSGFVNGDTRGVLTRQPTVTTAATSGSHVAASPFTIDVSGAEAANYDISYVSGTLTVTPAPLSVTAGNKNKVYGDALPILTASFTGFVNGDTQASLTTAPTLTTAATASAHIEGSPYSIIASGAVDDDYTISYTVGALTIAPAPLTIKANNRNMTYGSVFPVLTASYTGFVNGDQASALTTPPALSTTATPNSASGSYPITASGAVDPNYTISYVAGTLTITPSTNAVLTTFTTTPKATLTVVPGADYKDYEATVNNSISSIQIIAATQDATATFTVDGVAGTSGLASAPIQLNIDTTTIYTTIMAGDGVTRRTYALKVTRQLSNNAVLTTFTTTPKATLTVVPGTDYKDYEATVTSSTSSISVIAATQDAGATIKVNGVPATSGAASGSVHLNTDTTTIYTTVTAADEVTKKTYAIKVTRQPSNNAVLSTFTTTPKATLTVVPGTDYKDYEATVTSSTTSISVIAITQDATATLTVNSVPAASGFASSPVQLNVDTTTIYTTVTAGDGVTKKTYAIKVTRQPSNNAVLTTFTITPKTTLMALTGTDYRDYQVTVKKSTTSINVFAITQDATATLTVNGVPATSGAASGPVQLNADTTTIYTTVTAGDGITKKTYAILVTRVPSNNAVLTTFTTTPKTTLTVVPGTDYKDYVATVSNATSSISIFAVTQDATAAITVNGVPATSGTASDPVHLNVDTNTIYTTVTAGDGVTKKTYAILITRAAPPGLVMKYETPDETLVTGGEIVVHQNVSPNGDGRSDGLVIEGIAAHPDNRLQIMSRSGVLVYEVKGYDNAAKVFDGHSSTSGKLQQAGTYFYSLEYKDGNETKHKTGYIVLKY